MMIRRMPVGIQDFEKLRSGNYLYVDKTAYIHRLAEESAPYFLGRPRRFGKSLLISTFKAYFQGRKDLFEGHAGQASLAVAELEKDWTAYPVFHLDFVTGVYDSPKGLEETLDKSLRTIEAVWGRDEHDISAHARLEGLIRRAFEKSGKKVVVLVDEYDKPLLSSLEKGIEHDKIRDTLKAFYSVLKGADHYLRFVFLTGITKFSKVSLFSDLNQLRDISMLPAYAGICGITETELADNFEPEIKALACATGASYDETLEQLKQNYNGYHFSEDSEGVFNPFSLLNTFANGKISYYWFETGTPTFLIKEMQKNRFNVSKIGEGVMMKQGDIVNYALGENPVPMLYQSGYLTIKSYDQRTMRYTLVFPNDEVKYGFLENLLAAYAPVVKRGNGFFVEDFLDDLAKGDIDSVMRRFQAFFANIPYDITDSFETEQHYQTVFYIVFTLLGQYTGAELRSAAGRADAVVKTDDTIYVFEFKLNTGEGKTWTAEDALKHDRDYLIPYQSGGRGVVKVGAVFDREKRNLSAWASEAVR
jgi:hypothetical protein